MVAAITIAAAVVALLGALMTLRGLRPPRSGDTPYCRKCGYNLTGRDRTAALARCSECGTELASPRAVVLGERHVRRGVTAAGLICLLLGLPPLTVVIVGTARGANWYVYKPTRWVLADIRSSNTLTGDRAFAEMVRRERSGNLSPVQLSAWIETCLDLQAQTSSPWEYRTRVELERLRAVGKLTVVQTDRYYENLLDIQLRVRPIVVRGQEFPLGVFLTRSPILAIQARIDDVRVDGRSMEPPVAPAAYSPRAMVETRLNLNEPGRHRIAVDVSYRITPRRYGFGLEGTVPDGPALHVGNRMISADIDVLEEESASLIKMTHSAELDAILATSVELTEFRFGRRLDAQSSETTPTTHLRYSRPIPVGLAFQVFAEFGGERIELPSITRKPNEDDGAKICWLDPPKETPERVTVVLRSSKVVARLTYDLYDIWDGELRFEGVRVIAVDAAGRRRSDYFGDLSDYQDRYSPQVARRPADVTTLPAGNAQELPPTPH